MKRKRAHLMTCLLVACGGPAADESTQTTDESTQESTGDGDGDGDGDADACPLSADARTLLEEQVVDLELDISWMVTHAPAEQEAVFAFSLPGVEGGHLASAFLIAPCSGPESFIGYCEPNPELGVFVCSRITCEAAGVRVCESWFSGADAIDPVDASAIGYAATSVAGQATYAQAPLRAWRLALAGEQLSITSAWTHTLQIADVDFAHDGEIVIEMQQDAVLSQTITLSYPGIALDGVPVTLSIAGQGESPAGTVMHADAIIGTIEHGAAPPIAWLDPC